MGGGVRALRLAAALVLPLLLCGTALAASLTVTSPNGGETWAAGTTQTIRWSYSGSLRTTVSIQLLKNGATLQTLSSSAPTGSAGAGSFNWAIPATLTPGTGYQIRVVGVDSTTSFFVVDTSDASFTISSAPAASLTVTSPNGGESWRQGSTHAISWSYSGSPGATVKIELLKGGSLNSTLTASVPIGSSGSGAYSWAIPANQTMGGDYAVRVSSTTTSTTDTSDANFTVAGFTLTVNPSGTGSGRVTSSPAGIDCGATCAAAFDSGTPVTLTATPDPNNSFTGWSGDCAGTGTCQLTMSADHSATASFTGPPPTLTVTAPNGGEVWPGGTTHTISWSYTGNPGAAVKIELLKGGVLNSTLTASTSVGSSGSGAFSWNIPAGQATGSDYQVRVSSTTTAATDTSNANFTLQQSFTLTVSKSGTGTGRVSSSPPGIDCGATCAAGFADGTPVTLTATPDANNSFAGWAGDCAGSGTCLLTLSANHSATASFTAPPGGITVTTPNGGQVWVAGFTQTIKWSYTGNPGSTVKIELLKSGVLNSTLSSSTSIGSAGSGSFSWLIPASQPLGNDYRIRITSTSNAAFTDTSDADFRINSPGIQVTSPNGGRAGTRVPPRPSSGSTPEAWARR